MIADTRIATQDQPLLNSTATCNGIPVILNDEGIFYLVGNISQALLDFLSKGKSDLYIDECIAYVFQEALEKLIKEQYCIQYDLHYSYCTKEMEYLGMKIEIRYLCITNPITHIKMKLIPWFMLPRMPYPIIVYLNAVNHYEKNGEKSMREAAEATRNHCLLETFDKATLSRWITADHLPWLSKPFTQEGPMSPMEDEESIVRMFELLRTCHSFEEIKKELETGAVEPQTAVETESIPVENGSEIHSTDSGIAKDLEAHEVLPETTQKTGGTEELHLASASPSINAESGNRLQADTHPSEAKSSNLWSKIASIFPARLSINAKNRNPQTKSNRNKRQKRPTNTHRPRAKPNRRVFEFEQTTEERNRIRLEFIEYSKTFVLHIAVTYHEFLC